MGFSHDTHPFIGHSPDEPRKWVIGGFHGHGMVRIWLCGKALVEQLLSQNLGLEKPWPEWMPKAYIYDSSRCTKDKPDVLCS
jgi:glycine/D-amino acid oxidase-like deaminating enzyme